MTRDPSRSRDVLTYAALALLLMAVFVSMAVFRLIDADEGIYLANARMVLDGQMPYRDFQYPQMFLLPYLYAWWMNVAGVSWYSARILSALLAVALGLLLYHHVTHRTRRRGWGALAVVILASTSLAFAWYPLVKTYAFGTLTLFLAYSILAWGTERWRCFLSALLLGLAIDTRLYLLAVVPVFAALVLGERDRFHQLGRFALGLGLALLPNAFFLFLNPDTFVFNIIGYHAIRSDWGLIGALPQKAEAVANMFGINGSFGITSFQFSLLVVATIALVVATWSTWARVPSSLWIAGVIFVVSLLPTPTYGQYYSMFLPFLIAAMVELLASIPAEVADPRVVRRLRRALGVLVTLYVVVAPIDVYWYTVGGAIVPGVFVEENAKNWTIPAVTRVGKAIDAAMPPGETTAISWWPGYFVETRATIFQPLANPNAFWYAHRLTPEQVVRYHFITHGELMWHIRTHQVPVVVLGNWTFTAKPIYAAHLATSGYVMVTKLGDTEIYRWSPSGR